MESKGKFILVQKKNQDSYVRDLEKVNGKCVLHKTIHEFLKYCTQISIF